MPDDEVTEPVAASSTAGVARAKAPMSVRGAAAIVALEGLVLVLLAPILVVAGIVMSKPDSSARAWAEVVFALAGGTLVMFLALALSRVALWSRAPVVVVQLLALPVGYSLAFGSQQPLYGIPLLTAAAAVLYLLFTPESRLALFRDVQR